MDTKSENAGGGGEFYLEANVCKSGCKTDDAGNCLFEVEASNENLDFQNQKVLQRALMDSRDNFLKYGVISNDHLHHKEGASGEKITCPDQIIGEPVSVRNEGGKTIVTAKLYRSNPVARAFIRLLKDGSTRVRASIGGIFPKVKRLFDGTEAVTSLVWNDLALTATPVNNTVGCAHLVKSYKPDEFVKALTAGYETDSAAKEGGGALIKEDIRKETVDAQDETAKCVTPQAVFPTLPIAGGADGPLVSCYDASKPFSLELVIAGDVDLDELRQFAKQNQARGIVDATLSERLAVCELVEQLGIGAIQNSEEALAFLVANGVADDKAREYLRDIETTGGYLMKKSLGARLSNIVKSLKKSSDGTELENENIEGAANDDQPSFFDDQTEGGGDEYSDDLGNDEDIDLDEDDEDDINLDDEDFASDEGDFDDEDDEELVDGTDVVKSLSRRMARLEKSMKSLARLEKSVNAIGKTVAMVGETVAGIGNARSPRIAKSYSAGGYAAAGGAKVPQGVPTEKDFQAVQDVLQKSVQSGEITLIESSKMSSEFQHAMRGKPLSSATYSFLAKRIKG